MNSKKFLLFFSTLIIWSQFSFNLIAQNQNQLPEHPRLLFTNDDLQKYKLKLQNDTLLKKLHDAVIYSSDEILNLEPLKFNKKGKRLLGISRVYLKRLFYLSYAYRLTNNKSYAEKAEREMIAAASFINWNPSHFLDVAEMTMALAVGYDWLYHEISPESKERIKAAILQYGLIASINKENNWWLKRKHNWNQVCNAGITFGALAIYEDIPQMAEEMVGRSLESIILAQEDYEPDGAYVEGSSYWGYGTTFNTLFIEAIRKIPLFSGYHKINPGFLKTGEYFLHVFGPTGSFNYFDNSSNFSLNPAIFWFAKETSDPSLIFHQIPLLKNLKSLNPEEGNYRIFPMVPIWLSLLESKDGKPKKLSWTGRGPNPVSFHRTSWKNDAIFIGIKGGRPGLNHGHMDAGSFVMDANGVRWVKDLGGHPYYELEKEGFDLWNRKQESQRWTLFRYSNFAHSTLVVNDSLQRVNGNCEILEAFENNDKKGAVIDLTEVYDYQLEKVIRSIYIENKEKVCVLDSLFNSDKLAKVRWGILTFDSINIIGKNEAVVNNDGKNLLIKINEPENVQITIYSTDPNYVFEEDNPGTAILGFEIELLPNEQLNIDVDLLPTKFN